MYTPTRMLTIQHVNKCKLIWHWLYYFILDVYLFIDFKVRIKERERVRDRGEVFQLLILSPSGCVARADPGQSQEPGVWSVFPTCVTGAQALGHLLLLFTSRWKEAWSEVKQPGHRQAPIWDTGVAGSSFTYYAIVSAQTLVILA